MAIQNLTPEQLSQLQSGDAEKLVDEIHGQLETAEGGAKKFATFDYCSYWGLIRFALVAAKVFTPANVDKKIDEIVKAGDDTCGERRLADNAAAGDAAAAAAEAPAAGQPAPPASAPAAPAPAPAEPVPVG